jgi:transposase
VTLRGGGIAPTEVCPPEIRSIGPHLQRRDGADDRDRVDTHKRSHTLVALDAATGAARGQLTMPAHRRRSARRVAVRFRTRRVVRVGGGALSACVRSARARAVASSDHVVRVAPDLTDTSAACGARAGQSDPIDATAIARAALREGIDALPVAFLDEHAHEIRVLSDYRDQLINERVRLASRLGWHLVQIAPELEAQVRPQGLADREFRAKVARGIADRGQAQAQLAKVLAFGPLRSKRSPSRRGPWRTTAVPAKQRRHRDDLFRRDAATCDCLGVPCCLRSREPFVCEMWPTSPSKTRPRPRSVSVIVL